MRNVTFLLATGYHLEKERKKGWCDCRATGTLPAPFWHSVGALHQPQHLHHNRKGGGTALKRSPMTKHDRLWCFHPFSGSLKKTTLTDQGDIDVCAWHFNYLWQRREHTGRGWGLWGAFIKLCQCLECQGGKARWRYRGYKGENDAKWSSNTLLIHSSVKRAAHALAYFSLEGMFANDIFNKRHTDDIAKMAIGVLPNISVRQLANALLAMSVHFHQT